MLNKTDAFIRILLIELEDLKEDIKLLIEKYKRDHENEKISNYVFQENVALMHNEIFGVDGLYEQVQKMSSDTFIDIDEIVTAVDEKLEMLCKKKGHVRSICVLVRRKIDKIRRYIEGTY